MKTYLAGARRLVLWNVAVLLLLGLTMACGAAEEPTATATSAPVATATPTPTDMATPTPTLVGEQPRRGGILTVSGRPPTSFDGQLLANSPGHSEWIGKMMNNLFINYEGTTLECEICTEWHLDNAGKTMVFNLIPGIKFHDGKEMDSSDVAYSLDMIMGRIDGSVSQRSGVIKEFIDSMETPSKYELRINMARPSSFVPKVLAVGPSMLYPNGTTREELKAAPRGSGPFLLGEVIPGASWTVERNPNYFKAGQPYLDGVFMVRLADTAASIAAFLTHKTHWISNSSEQYEKSLGDLVAEGKVTEGLNKGGCGPQFLHFNPNKPPYDDLNIRKAANLALDRKVLEEFTYGLKWSVPQVLFANSNEEFGTPEDDIWDKIPGWGTGANKEAELDEARKLVIDAGFPDGLEVRHMQKTPLTSANRRGGEITQAMLKKVGINVTFDLVDAPQHDIRIQNRDFLAQWYQFCLVTRDVDEIVGQYWITGAARNLITYSSSEVDSLYLKMSAELDPTKRKDLFLQIQDIIVVQDVGHAPASGADRPVYWWKDLGGFSANVFSYNWSAGRKRADQLWLKP